MKKGDYAIFVGLLIIAAVLWWVFSAPKAGDTVNVVIQKDGQQVFTAPLEGTDTEWADAHNRVAIQNGEVFMEWSDCANQVCVHSGRISEAGQQIVCLPNRLIVRLEAEDADLDGMTY